MIKTKDYFKQIADQEKKSSESWRKSDLPTSPEERVKNMYNRVLNKAKTDKEEL